MAIPVDLQSSLLRRVAHAIRVVRAGACRETIDVEVDTFLIGARPFGGVTHLELFDALVILDFKLELLVSGYLTNLGNKNVDHVDVLVVGDTPDTFLEDVGEPVNFMVPVVVVIKLLHVTHDSVLRIPVLTHAVFARSEALVLL